MSVHNTRMWPPFAVIILPKRTWMLEKGSGSRVTWENFKNAQHSCHLYIFLKLPSKCKHDKTPLPTQDSYNIIKDLTAALKQTRRTRPCCCSVCPNSTAEGNSSDSYMPPCHQGHSSCQKYTLWIFDLLPFYTQQAMTTSFKKKPISPLFSPHRKSKIPTAKCCMLHPCPE